MKFLTWEKVLLLVRYSLGIAFVWFGILKLFNASPVTALINNVISPFSFPMEIPLIGLFEVFVGIGFFTKRFIKVSSVLMICYLIVITILVLLRQGFSPWFPLLTFEGEFVIKNLVLISAGLVLLTSSSSLQK